jgi:hypothetical protein
MAKVLGQSARYVSQQAVKKRRQIVCALAILGVAICTGTGFFAGFLLQEHTLTTVMATLVLLLDGGFAWSIATFGGRWLEKLEKKRLAMRKGAVGEAVVAAILEDFPDDFYVVNDLTTPFGNVDHVVVGPTGVS